MSKACFTIEATEQETNVDLESNRLWYWQWSTERVEVALQVGKSLILLFLEVNLNEYRFDRLPISRTEFDSHAYGMIGQNLFFEAILTDTHLEEDQLTGYNLQWYWEH